MRAVHTACMEEPSLEFLAFALKTTTDHSASTLMDITPVRPAVKTKLSSNCSGWYHHLHHLDIHIILYIS